MNYLLALSIVLSLNDNLVMLQTIKEQNERLQRRSPGDITFDDLSVFNNRHIDQAKRELRLIETRVDRALSEEHEWPQPPTPEHYYEYAVVAATRRGPDSQDFRSALEHYRNSLIRFGILITNPIRGRLSRQNRQELERRRETAGKIRDYSQEIAEMLRLLSRLPYPLPSTALQAQFVSYERHMRDIIGLASRIHNGYDRLIRRNAELTAEIRSRADSYQFWIDQLDQGETERQIRAALR